jgi:hypothetical protein
MGSITKSPKGNRTSHKRNLRWIGAASTNCRREQSGVSPAIAADRSNIPHSSHSAEVSVIVETSPAGGYKSILDAVCPIRLKPVEWQSEMQAAMAGPRSSLPMILSHSWMEPGYVQPW